MASVIEQQQGKGGCNCCRRPGAGCSVNYVVRLRRGDWSKYQITGEQGSESGRCGGRTCQVGGTMEQCLEVGVCSWGWCVRRAPRSPE